MNNLPRKAVRLCKNAAQEVIGKERYKIMYLKRCFREPEIRDLVVRGYKESKLLEKETLPTEDYPVDFVVPWVDENDPEWQKEKEHYLKSVDDSHKLFNSNARYRNWDLFMYWFRSVEKYAPWVNNVYLVTCGHVPKWLNVNHPKLKLVRHSDYIPATYLPTFNANPIELNIHMIPQLSEHFVYFNDDMFLNAPVEKADFFQNGLPRLCAITTPQKSVMSNKAFDLMLFNALGAYNETFDIRGSIRQHPEKWFHYLYEDIYEYTARIYRDGFLTGMFFSHVCTPMRKSSMEACSRRFSELIDRTSRNRFRSHNGVNRQIYHLWELLNNTFEPVGDKHMGRFVNVHSDKLDDIEKILNDSSIRCLCANDHEGVGNDDFTFLRNSLVALFEKKYPEKSLYEL